jgi:hypothetical protein
MTRKIHGFLNETWQLFYWSLFFPSRLQKRINDWSPQKNRSGEIRNTSYIEILLLSINFRFAFQYFLIMGIFSLPLVGLIAVSGKNWDWLIWIAEILVGYIIGLVYLPSGISFFSPLLVALIYYLKSELIRTESIQYTSQVMEILPQLSVGIGISSIALFINFLVIFMLLKKSFLKFAHYILWIGSGLSILIGSWVISRNWFVAILLSIITGFSMFLFRNKIDSEHGVKYVATSMVFVLPSFVPLLLVYGLLQFATFIFILVHFAPLYLFLSFCALVSFGLAPTKRKWLGIWIAAIFIMLGIKLLNVKGFWAFPVSLVFYYRILPDYLLAFLKPFLNRCLGKPSLSLRELPPYTSEIIWLPLPNHAQLLVNTFNQDISLGIDTFVKMQIISLPGFNSTIKKALPVIVANQFAAVQTITELMNSITSSHPVLPSVIPTFYQYSQENFPLLIIPRSSNPEIDLLFPIFQQLAKNTAAALKSEISALRERGLERIVDDLKMLPAQLPILGLDNKTVKLWQPAIKRWQNILELEIAEQQKISQGELFNPFQFGNPLHQDNAAIFKGRQAFADQLVRIILDRNRPTLVILPPQSPPPPAQRSDTHLCRCATR